MHHPDTDVAYWLLTLILGRYMRASDWKAPKRLSESHLHQINVLKVLSADMQENAPRHYHLHEIADLSGLKDEKETQRYLFILEGQKLVAPCPKGDFTSRVWHITDEGVWAMRSISKAMVQ